MYGEKMQKRPVLPWEADRLNELRDYSFTKKLRIVIRDSLYELDQRRCNGSCKSDHASKDRLESDLLYLDCKPSQRGAPYISYKNRSGSRVVSTVYRMLNRCFWFVQHYELTESEVETIGNNIGIECYAAKVKEGLYTGEDLRQKYEASVGGSSCMTGSGRSSCLELYVQNPDRVGLLILTKGNQSGRALVWTLDNGKKFVDRIYCNSSSIRGLFYNYARKNKCWYRHGDSILTYKNQTPSWSVVCEDLIVSGLKNSYQIGRSGTPYMDTMRAATAQKNWKIKLECFGVSHGYDSGLTSTSGRGLYFTVCGHCGNNSERAAVRKEAEFITKDAICPSCSVVIKTMSIAVKKQVKEKVDRAKVRYARKLERDIERIYGIKIDADNLEPQDKTEKASV